MAYHLFSWGANSHGQLGQGFRSEECTKPRIVDLSKCSLDVKNIVKIIGGAGHTLILDNRGHVYSCGWNNKGQAGFPIDNGTLFFRKVGGELEGQVVVDIACGWDSSAALTKEGILYVWGSNNYGQLGKQPAVVEWTHEPFPALSNQKIERISMGLRHTALITEGRTVRVAGSGSKGQLGLDPSRKDNPQDGMRGFVEVPAISNAIDVACGQHHTIVIDASGELYAFGDNKHGQLGLDPATMSRTLTPIKLTNVRFQMGFQLISGWTHTILLNDGQLFAWGRNTYGQLACPREERKEFWRISQVTRIPKLRQVATGSEHVIALSEDNSILSWGWNEHGNCGVGHKRDVLFPERVTFTNSIVTLIGAGAGHSFAVIKTMET